MRVALLFLAACSAGGALPPDAPDAGPDARCDVFAQSGCAAGTQCGYHPVLGPTCVAAGTRAAGETCDDDCAAGLACVHEGASIADTFEPRVCRSYCAGDADCTPPDRCLGTPRRSVGTCVPACAAYAGDCPAGRTCEVRPLAGSFCRDTGARAVWEPCFGESTSCPADTMCIAFDGQAEQLCRPYCDAAHPCPEGRDCRPLDDRGQFSVCS